MGAFASLPADPARTVLDAAPDATLCAPRGAVTCRVRRQPHVLLVEDDAGIRGATRLLLKVVGYRVTDAGCVAEAAALAREHEALDVLITDDYLGNLDTGLDAIAAVRAAHGRHLAAVVVADDRARLMMEFECDSNTHIAATPIIADEFLALLAALHG